MEGKLFLVVVTSIISWCAWRVYNWIWREPMNLQRCLVEQGIRGTHYKILLGDLKEKFRMDKEVQSAPIRLSHRIMHRVLPLQTQALEKYGKMSLYWFGPTPIVQIMDHDLIREVLVSKFGDFHKIIPMPVNLLVTGVTAYDGEKWVKHRKIINPAFHQEQLKMMLPAFYASCNEMLSKWQKIVFGESDELDVWDEFQNLTRNVISRTAFGHSYEDGRRIFQLQDEMADLVIQAVLLMSIPGFRFLPTKRNKRIKAIYAEVRTLLRDIIYKREKAMETGESKNDDLLGLLMESNFKKIQENGNAKNLGMSVDDIVEECKLFYFAGQESTSTLLAWTMIALSMHPEWQVKAREEILQVFGKEKPDFDGLNKLKIVTMILYEVLRLYPPLPMLMRDNYKTTKLGEVYLPPGVHIVIPTLLIHRDHELWGDDAEEFKPERFFEGVSNATKNRVSFFPFSWGPKICVGQNFAMIEVKMALAMILQHFSFELSSTYVHAPYMLLTLQPQHGAQLILHKI